MTFARVRALVVIGVLAVAAVVFMIIALVRDTQHGAIAQGCPAGSVMADISLPANPRQVTLKVYNGTSTNGLAQSVTTDFANRNFRTQKPAENRKRYKGVAQVRYGPQAVGKAQLVKAFFLAQAEPIYDPKRKGAVVDVIIGSQFQQLGTPTEVNQSLVELGEPDVPPGACAEPPKKKD